MSTTAFGDYSIEFSHPQEFTLPAEILPTSEGSPIASASAFSPVYGASVIAALNTDKCKWSVVSVPPSVSAASISITPTTSSSVSASVNNNNSNKMNNEGGSISEAADVLFMQALAAAASSSSASKDVPHLAGEDRLLSNMTPSQHQHPYDFLRIGMDPKDPLPVGISLPLLVSSIGELASSYGLDNLQEGGDGGAAKAEAFGGMFSRNAVLFLAWQRVSQLLAEGVLTKRLAAHQPATKTLGVKRARDEEATASTDEVVPSTLSSAYTATSEEGYEAKVSHLRAISSLLQGRLANGIHLTSKGIQTALQIPGVNTTSPFAEPLSTSNSIGTDSGEGGNMVEAALAGMLAPQRTPTTKATASTNIPQQRGQPSPFVVKMWNGAEGLTSANSRSQEVPLHMGVNTFGKTVTTGSPANTGVVGMSDLVPSTSLSSLPNAMFRLIVKADPLDDQKIMPRITAVPCGGGAGIRVEGRRWGMGECIPIKEHEVVHVGSGIVFTVRAVTP